MLWSSRFKESLPPSPLLMPKALWQILYSRGIQTQEEINKFYAPQLKDIRDPFSLSGMSITVDRILSAIENNEQITVYADYDLDGSPGGVLLKRGLEAFGAKEVFLRQPKRLSEGYGVHRHIIEELAEKGTQLIMTVDVGITDVLAAQKCQELGIDLIITDHHLPKEVLPEALAIVNPNSGQCDSGLGHLCGTGVAFYVLMALRNKTQSQVNLKQFLDLFTLATVTDMVPMVDENRVLIKHGLKVMKNSSWPGLGALLSELGFKGKDILSSDIGFRIAPKLNALSRLEEGLFPADVLLADSEKAKTICKEVMGLNDRRRKLQEEVFENALEKVNFQFSKQEKPFVTVFSEDYHPGVISVVANKLMEKYSRPVFIATLKSDGHYVGSSRSPKAEINLQDVLSACEGSLEGFGGHKMAAGFEVLPENLDSFQEDLDKYFKTNNSALGFKDSGTDFYDAELELEDLNENFMRWYLGLEPFGTGFEDPMFLMRGLKIKTIKELKKPHLKLVLTNGSQAIEVLWFSAPEEHAFNEGDTVDILGRPSWNEWMGRRRIQWTLSSIRPS